MYLGHFESKGHIEKWKRKVFTETNNKVFLMGIEIVCIKGIISYFIHVFE
jgi:hypothetical protein